MRKEQKISKASWPKLVVKKLLNMKSCPDEYLSDYAITGKVEKVERRRKSCSDQGSYVVVPEEITGSLIEERDGIERPSVEDDGPSAIDDRNLRMFVGTWNVGGKAPHDGLTLGDWLRTPTPADIYVLGFQEVVPLNAGNVLGAEDNGPAAKWLSLIRQELNGHDCAGVDTSGESRLNNSFSQSSSDQEPDVVSQRISFSDLLSLEKEQAPDQEASVSQRKPKYCLAASKQMVGLFLCVWVRSDLRPHISSLKVSCVGTGIMGYLGNKGSISISMILLHTSFCFVCTHLASGEKEGDEIKRNSDVVDILRKTRFCHPLRLKGQLPVLPEGILDHEKIIWLGDLNYRLAPNGGDAIELLKRNDWQTLLEKDQLRIEQKAGRVFKGWEEGKIQFAPTYKYRKDSDDYVVQTSTSKERRRTPAWCDRILWKGEGLKQMWYERGESKFSDHRPVSSLFLVQVNAAQTNYYDKAASSIGSNTNNTSASARFQAEEFLILSKDAKFIQTAPLLKLTTS
ncbi:OLC1v1034764C1 [Oldenlandia corymbosa var. corymbosa]|uniref:OLC1v1034764C1 n=1 Tax=Oldenlandia corymbosa var. corymbosa TaxID=529605 RepID=A0AAV1CRB2_OLDCO|nr:OLC1v1034764C1 [Oldenlandia corymbosa var. corymbosa]